MVSRTRGVVRERVLEEVAYCGFPGNLVDGHVALAFLCGCQTLEGIDVMTVNGGVRLLSYRILVSMPVTSYALAFTPPPPGPSRCATATAPAQRQPHSGPVARVSTKAGLADKRSASGYRGPNQKRGG